MNKIVFLIAAVVMMAGCAAKEDQLTLCIGVTQGECPDGFREADGEVVAQKIGGDLGGQLADGVLTCWNYSDEENLTCPDGTVKQVIDIIK